MPRTPKRGRRADGYRPDQIDHLLFGHSLVNVDGHDGFGWDDRFDEAAAKLAWDLMRDELVSEWIAARPGSRPWGWWKWEAPERRQRIDGLQHPFDDVLRQQQVELRAMDNPKFRDWAYQLLFGVPSCLFMAADFGAKYEGELQFLDRLGLLTPGEKTELYQ